MTVDYNELKKGGFLKQKQKNKFIVRFRSLAGNLTSEQLRALADLADKYGQNYVHVTTRQGMEIPFVEMTDYIAMKQDIKELGLNTGTCGPRIRTIVACPGSEVCGSGLMNTRAMALRLDEAFFCREVPMKTKIGITGCPNSCAKPQENDIGLMGAVEPVLKKDLCIGCGLCQRVCPSQAISMLDGKPVLDEAKCLHEGNCIASCPVDAWIENRRGYHVYAGGKIGRKPRLGQIAARFVPEDQVLNNVEAVLKAFEVLGTKGERVADTISRIGLETFQKEMEVQNGQSNCC